MQIITTSLSSLLGDSIGQHGYLAEHIRRHVLIPPAETTRASRMLKDIARAIVAFRDENVQPEHELGIEIANSGIGLFYWEGMGCIDPSLITFSGCTRDGRVIELVQHVDLVNFTLATLPRRGHEETREPFGFNVG